MRHVLLGLLLLPLFCGPTPAGEGTRTIGRVFVHRDGFHRIKGEHLQRLGAPSAAHVSVFDGRSSVPTWRGEGAGKDLVFLVAQHAPRYLSHAPLAQRAVFELRLHAKPRPVDVAAPAPAGTGTAPLAAVTRWIQRDTVSGDVASAKAAVYDRVTPVWFYAMLKRGSRVELALDPAGAARGKDQQLSALVYTNTLGAVQVRAVWNGHDLGLAAGVRSKRGAAIRLTWPVPAASVPEATAPLFLRDESPELPPAEDRDVSGFRGRIWIDTLELRGPTAMQLTGPAPLAWRVPPTGATKLTSPGAKPYALLVREVDGEYDWYQTAVGTDGAVSWNLDDEGAMLIAAAQAHDVTPTAWGKDRPDPLAKARGARHVIFSIPALEEQARRLAEHRAKSGLPSTVVTTTDVLASERYGLLAGRPVTAYHRFLQDLARRKDVPVDYVVIAGDATLDRVLPTRHATIPTPMARTKYNGATSSDRLYVRGQAGQHEPAIGRLPFQKAAEMQAYVDRVIRYETKPPVHASRRMLRFITSEGRFSPLIDKLIESKFRSVLARQVPPAYDVEVTYANPRSAFLWPPPELSAKVISGLNDGALFFTYVGHGFEKGFDTLRIGAERFGILHVRDVEQVDVRNTPPIVFVLACTTAMFDGTRGDGIGEALLKRPNGPVAYWGASRVCHPVFNAFIGEAVASNLGKGGDLDRIGAILAQSRKEAPALAAKFGPMLKLLPAVDDIGRLFVEGSLMYTLLGDPALKVAFPRTDVAVQATYAQPAGEIHASIGAALPDGTSVQVSLEVPRNVDRSTADPVANPRDPASFAVIRKNHARVNDRALQRVTLTLKDGKAEVRLPWKGDEPPSRLVVKAWCIAEGEVHQGAVVLK